MITRFMRDAPLAAIEIEMQLFPALRLVPAEHRSQQKNVNSNPILYEELLELEDMDAAEIVNYKDEILAAIEREELPNEGDHGSAVYLDYDVLKGKCTALIPLLKNGVASCGGLQKYSRMAN